MSHSFKHWWLAVGALLIGLCPVVARATEPGVSAGGHLVSAAWLKQHLGRPEVLVLDASPARLHQSQHIPGAISAPLFTMGPRDVPQAQVQDRLRAWGAGPKHRLVITDQGGTYLAARLFWDLLHHGMPPEQLALLDGGMAHWVSSGGVVTSNATPSPPAGEVRLQATDPTVRVMLPEFLAATGDPQRQVALEALDPTYFYGAAAFFNRAGHVPHARLMPADDFYNADKTFKSADEIGRMLKHLGIGPEQAIHTYCGGGGAAAVPFFALKFILGYPRVTLFRESQLGWLQDDRELPVWTYAAPYLLRDSAWLKPWNSPMLRAFGLSKLSIIDVRPEAAFRQGHLPHAVNVPAAVFEQSMLDLPGLAWLLSAAGVPPDHEAVVFSEGGVNPASAIAFWMLERVGQHKVSVFTDSIERWAELGHEVSTDGPAARPEAGVGPGALPPLLGSRAPGLYSGALPRLGAQLRQVVRADGPSPSSGAAGQALVLRPDALLTTQGLPKPAKEIWAAMSDASISRYSELRLVASTPALAAMNYVVLRLMGMPDVAIWLP